MFIKNKQDTCDDHYVCDTATTTRALFNQNSTLIELFLIFFYRNPQQ